MASSRKRKAAEAEVDDDQQAELLQQGDESAAEQDAPRAEAQDQAEERPHKKHRTRPQAERAYDGPRGYERPPPRSVTRRLAATRRIKLAHGLPYEGRVREGPPRVRQPPRDWLEPYYPNWGANYIGDDAHHPPPPTQLRQAHDAAVLQLGENNWKPLVSNGRGTARPRLPDSWFRTVDGPQSFPIMRIIYGNLTDAARAKSGEAVVNTALSNITTAHRWGDRANATSAANRVLTSVSLCTSSLPIQHPLLRLAPKPRRGEGYQSPQLDHALLAPDHPLLTQAPRQRRRQDRGESTTTCDGEIEAAPDRQAVPEQERAG